MIDFLIHRMAQDNGASLGTTVNIKHGDEILDGPYPKSFANFIGQDDARSQILAAVSSSSKRDTRLDHMLLASGYPGVGKTTLARLTAHMLDVGFIELGDKITTQDALKALRGLDDGDVVFIDEIHRLVQGGKARAEWLLTLMQDGALQTPRGIIKVPDVTVIAATTDAQRLPETILDRFVIKPRLVLYTNAQALQIARITAARLGFEDDSDDLPLPADESWLERVAAACDNNPRRISQLLHTIRDIALSSELTNYSPAGYDISLALQWCGLSEDGLTASQQDYLAALYAYGGKAGAATIRAILNESELSHTEKALIQKGYIVITSGGRTLTDYGALRAEQVARAQVAAAREESA